MVHVYHLAYSALLIIFNTVYAEIYKNIPYLILFKKDLPKTTFNNVLNTVLKTDQKKIQEKWAMIDVGDDFTEDDDDVQPILKIMDLKNNPVIRQNNEAMHPNENIHRQLSIPANVVPNNDKNQIIIQRADDNSTEFRKSNWRSSCDRKAARQCKKACIQAFRNTCSIFRCKRRFKKGAKKECKSSCRSKFSGDRSGSGSGSESSE